MCNNTKENLVKKCNKCGLELSIDNFYKRNVLKNYYQSRCKTCFMKINNEYKKNNKEKIQEIKKREYLKNKKRYTNYNLKRSYNISIEDYNNMLLKQDNKCYICEKHSDDCFNGLVVDHNHKTNSVRKLICGQCNSVLGMSFENIFILNNVIKYIKEHNE